MRQRSFLRPKPPLQASVSLLAACLILAITSTGLITWLGISWRNQELTLDRYLNLQSNQILSLYSREALERYGLWGYDAKVLDEEFLQKELSSTAKVLSYQAEPSLPFSDPNVAITQVSAFSTTRVPLALIDELWGRIEHFRQAGLAIDDLPLLEGVSLPELPALPEVADGAKAASYTFTPSTDVYFSPRMLDFEEDPEAEEAIRESAQEDFAEVSEAVEDSLQGLLALDRAEGTNILTGFAASDENGIISTLLLLVSEGMKHLQFDYPRVLDKLLFQEYVINQFSSEVRGPAADSASGKDFLTLSGQKMSELRFASEHEAEEILLAQPNAFLRTALVTGLLASTRLALHYAAISNNPTKMSGYQSAAATLSSAVAILSLGTILLEPMTIARVFALIDAAIQMFSDVKALKQGKGVALYPLPGHSLNQVDLFYTDYLRLLGLFVPLEKQASSLSAIVAKNLGHELSSVIRLALAFSRSGREVTIGRDLQYAVLG